MNAARERPGVLVETPAQQSSSVVESTDASCECAEHAAWSPPSEVLSNDPEVLCTALMRLAGVTSRTEAIKVATRRGLVRLE